MCHIRYFTPLILSINFNLGLNLTSSLRLRNAMDNWPYLSEALNWPYQVKAETLMRRSVKCEDCRKRDTT